MGEIKSSDNDTILVLTVQLPQIRVCSTGSGWFGLLQSGVQEKNTC